MAKRATVKKEVAEAQAAEAEAKAASTAPRNITIDSIKVLNGEEGAKRHIIKYQEGGDKKTLDSPDMATDSFYRVFQSLGDDAMEVLELPEDYHFGVEVKSLNFRYEGSAMNQRASIGVMKKLQNKNGSCHLLTPALFVGAPTTSQTDSEPSNEGAEFTVHSKAAARRIRTMVDHATNYLSGKRADITMFEHDGEPTATAVGEEE